MYIRKHQYIDSDTFDTIYTIVIWYDLNWWDILRVRTESKFRRDMDFRDMQVLNIDHISSVVQDSGKILVKGLEPPSFMDTFVAGLEL